MRRRRATRRARRSRRSRRPTEGAAAAVALATRARGRRMARTTLTARMARRRRRRRPRAARTARPLKVRENYDAQAHYNYWRAIIGERASRGRLPFPALGCDGNDHPRGGVRRGGVARPPQAHATHQWPRWYYLRLSSREAGVAAGDVVIAMVVQVTTWGGEGVPTHDTRADTFPLSLSVLASERQWQARPVTTAKAERACQTSTALTTMTTVAWRCPTLTRTRARRTRARL